MENMKCLEKINRLSVRIAKDNGEDLRGSGVLYLRKPEQMPLVFTAAHVVTKLFKSGQDDVYLHIGCSDDDGNTKIININARIVKEVSSNSPKEGDIYIHPEYDNSKECPIADVAIIYLPWQEWMSTQSHLQFKVSHIGEKIGGWGFPESMEKDREKLKNDILIGKKKLTGEINHISKSKICSIDYKIDVVERSISRNSIMTGFSGSGLFSMEDKNISLTCIISGECGDKCAGTMLWACSVECCKELIEFLEVDLGCPDSFERYKEMAMEYFPKGRKNARRLFATLSEELMEDYNLIPESCVGELYDVLICESNRKWCDIFWIGKLKMLVMLYGSELISQNELFHPMVQMPKQYKNDKVKVEYICTEEETETTLGKLIEEEYFAGQKNLKNSTIFVLNSKLGNGNLNARYPKRECRQIIRDITKNTTYSERQLKKKIENLLPENLMGFDIINGVAARCNLAAIGVDRMVDVMNTREIDKTVIKTKMEEVLIDLWKE